jgi:hypothetical protein
MYHRGNNVSVSPFKIECSNCRSHDVDIHINKNELEIRCNQCGSYVDVDEYNELTYEEHDDGRSTGSNFFIAALVALVIVAVVMFV